MLPGAAALAQVLPASPPPASPPILPMVEPPASAPTELGPVVVGWHGSFFLRDSSDYFRFYPKMRAQIDFNSFFGSGVDKVSAADGGNALKNRLYLKRLLFEFAGEFLKRWTFYGSIELNQAVTNANGRTELAASRPGETPTKDSARFAPVQSAGIAVAPDDVWINFTATPWLQFMVGHYLTPFTMENRTSNKFIPFMERRIGLRSFALPAAQDIGVMAWGEIADKKFNYEIGVFAGEGGNRPQLDSQVDYIGRVFAKPLLDCKCALPNAQIGLSARHGNRDPAYVGYDYTAITSGQGFRLWSPQYTDSFGRPTHIVPSGDQNAIGGELRLPVSKFELRSEAYYVANNTREVVEGNQLTNTERVGQMRGVGWYVQLSAWPLGDTFVNGDPGIQRPTRIDFSKPPSRPKRGLEVLAVAGGINASYDGASRALGGSYDPKTPGNPSGNVGKAITVYEFGAGINYWHSSYIRTTVNYLAYYTPGSGSVDNLAAVPGNLAAETKESAHVLHELGFRVAVGF